LSIQKDKSLSDLGFALFEEEGQELRDALFSYGVAVADLSDFEGEMRD
jgi:hypothetical protein